MTTKPKIYLAGPIDGLHFNEAVSWRNSVKTQLEPEIDCFSPLRDKEFLAQAKKIEQSYWHPLASDRGIMSRDHNDCMKVDLIFCNLLGSLKISIGTVMEIAWAFAYRKPLVLAIEDHENLHDHPMIREAINFRVNNLETAVTITRSILLP